MPETSANQRQTQASNPYGQGQRSFLAKADGRGYCDYVNVREDLIIELCNRHAARSNSFNYVSEGLLKFHYRTSGTSEISFDNGQTTAVSGLVCGVLAQPKGDTKGEVCHGGESERWMTIHCSPEYITEHMQISPTSLPTRLREFLVRKNCVYQSLFPMESRAIVALNDLLTSDMFGEFRAIYMEGKALELISLTLNTLIGNPTPTTDRRITDRERKQFRRATHIIDEQLTSQVLLADLARQVGMNCNRLNQLFKSCMGLTYAQYALDRRMRIAHDLLREGSYSITEIAHLVGYNHSGNFSAAFRRFYGVSPKTYKLHL